VKRIGIAAFIAFAIGMFVVLGFSQMAVQPTLSDVPPLAENEQEPSLQTSDGVSIEASFFPATDPDANVILMLYGNGASRAQFASHISWLNEAGFTSMAIDFREHGESQPHNKSFGFLEGRDAAAAVRWLKHNHPSAKVGIIGVSLGGAAALLGENGPVGADAMVLKAVYPDFDRAVRNRVSVHGGDWLANILTPLLTQQAHLRYGVSPNVISPIKASGRYDRPVLVIGGTEDVYTPETESEQFAAAFAGRHWLWMVNGLGHNQLSDLDDEIYRERVLTFFNEEMSNLPKRSPASPTRPATPSTGPR